MAPAPQSWLTSRRSGVLAHISSLPSQTSIGNLGFNAWRFIDFLASAGFSHWQVCPVGPTGYGDSPYQSFSAFAGNPYFIDLEELVELGLLKKDELFELSLLPRDSVDYGALYGVFWAVLEKAYQRCDPDRLHLEDSPSFNDFYEQHSYWISDYTSFMALKSRFGQRSWTEWPIEYRDLNAHRRQELDRQTSLIRSRHAFYQYLFFSQWNRLKRYANERGVKMVGDIPIYVALDSADVWSRRANFRVRSDGSLDAIAGVPPDYFSETGQLWGNPLYDWNYLRENGYNWWAERIGASLELFDVIRLDHFRGFADYWAVPADAIDATRGHWETGPGSQLFQALNQRFPRAQIIAEDLGYINQQVFDLRASTGYPGMKILQFGYGHDDNHVNLPHFYERNQVVYTGTHDNDTTQGWIDGLTGDLRQKVFDYFDLNADPNAMTLVKAAFASVARLVIVPAQDLLELGSNCRMNRPGTAIGNWRWRLTEESLREMTESLAPRLKQLHLRYHRVNDNVQRDFSAPPAEADAVASVS